MVQSSASKEKIKFSTLETTRFVQKQDVLAKIANDETLYQKFKIWNGLSVEERKQRRLIPNLFNFLSVDQKDNQNDLEIIELMQYRNNLKQENKDFDYKYFFEQKVLDQHFRENRSILQRLINPDVSVAEQKKMKNFSAEETLEVFRTDFDFAGVKISMREQAALFHLIGKETEKDAISFVEMDKEPVYKDVVLDQAEIHQEIKDLFYKFKKPFTKETKQDLNDLVNGHQSKVDLFSKLDAKKENLLEQKQTILEITRDIDTLLIRSVKEEDPTAFLIDITPQQRMLDTKPEMQLEKPIFLLNAAPSEQKEIDNVLKLPKVKSGKLKRFANKIKIAASLLFVSALSIVTGNKTQTANKQASEIFVKPVMAKTVVITPQQTKPTVKTEKLEAKLFSAPQEKKIYHAATINHRGKEILPVINTDSLKAVSLHMEDIQKQETIFNNLIENKKIVLQNDTLSKPMSRDSMLRVSKLSFTL